MAFRVTLCLEVLLELVLDPAAWNCNKDDLETRCSETNSLLSKIESQSEELAVYIPSIFIALAHITTKISVNSQEAHRVVKELLNIRGTYLRLDEESILEQANAVRHYPEKGNFVDAVCLICANNLRLDAIVTRQADIFKQIIQLNQESLSNFNVPIYTPSEFIFQISRASDPTSSYDSSMFVYTPEARKLTLPRDATPIDFAYELHTDFGDRCYGALVNGAKVALNTRLKTGDVVEVLRNQDAHPDPAWIDFVVTRKAKSCIQRWFKRWNIQKGREMLDRELGRNVHRAEYLLKIVQQLPYSTVDDLVGSVGCGQQNIQQIRSIFEEIIAQEQHEQPSSQTYKWHIAGCCNPLPGEPIVGVGKGGNHILRIHHSDCPNLKNIQTSQKRHVAWDCDHCEGTLKIKTYDKPGAFQTILSNLADKSILIDIRDVSNYDDGTATAHFLIPITSRQQKDSITKEVKDMPEVLEVEWTKLIPGAIRFVPPQGAEGL